MKRLLVVLVVAGLLTGCQTLDEVRSAGQNKCGQWVGLLGNKNSCYSESEMRTARALGRMQDRIDQMESDRRWDQIQNRSDTTVGDTPAEYCTGGRVMTPYGCRYR
jgi:hypothetical protein